MYPEPTQGVAYIALGDRRFAEEALESVSTLRRHSPDLPALIYTDRHSPELEAAFDEVVVVRQGLGDELVGDSRWTSPGWLARIELFASFPFDRTLFLDTDTHVVGEVSDLLEILDRFDVAAAHAPFRFHEQGGTIPSSFPEFNCGVVSIRKSPGSAAFLDLWRQAYLAAPDFWHHDQHAFRTAAWASDVRIAALPPEFNLRPLRHSGRNSPRILHGFARPNQTPSSPSQRKIRFLSTEHGCGHHRAGWEFALASLRALTHPNGVMFDSMIENTYAWHLQRYQGFLPIREPWIGVAHVPPALPEGYFAHADPDRFMRTARFEDSLTACLGLFALSQHHASWLRQFGKPVEVLHHPVAFDVAQFSIDALRATRPRSLLHIGWWLRRFESFNSLCAPGYAKSVLALPGADAQQSLKRVTWNSDVRFVDYLANQDYDALLSRSVVFADLIDCSANNIVIDCIARATPLVVNRHPAIEEYLGHDYPLFYDSLEEAETLLANEELIVAASVHLARDAVRARLTGEYFRSSLVNSALYQSLPEC